MVSYEYSFGDVNPPVHAWAVLEVYRIHAAKNGGVKDTEFLERCFQKLLLNFTWWGNRVDEIGTDLNRHMLALFRRDADGRRPIHGDEPRFKAGGAWESLLIFPEYFCGDSGCGVGASHPTGGTALIAKALSAATTEMMCKQYQENVQCR